MQAIGLTAFLYQRYEEKKSALPLRSQAIDATLAANLSTGIRTSKSFEAVLEATGHFSRMRERIDRKENWLQKVLSEQSIGVPMGSARSMLLCPRLLLRGGPWTMSLTRKYKLKLFRLSQGVASTG